MWNRIIRRAQPVFLLLAALLVLLLIRSQWAELQSYDWQLNAGWLAASALLLVASWLMEIGIWRQLLKLVGGALPYLPATRIWFLSAIVRYIPGNIWQPLSMTLYCQSWRIRPEATLTSVLFYQVIILLAVAPIAAVYLLASGNLGLLENLLAGYAPWLAGLLLLPTLAFLMRPDWLFLAINWGLGKVGRPPLTTALTPRQLGIVVVAAVANWLLWGASFAALAFGIGGYDTQQQWQLLPHLIAAYPIAYAIGFVSFITPSGIGVREGAFYLLLAPILGGGVITVIALAMRFWTTVGELIMAALSAVTGGGRPADDVASAPPTAQQTPQPEPLRTIAPDRSA